ncbi:hypothetical protein ACFQ36_08430 [Arthrobacter sp. GCM10027362]|uniref:hypothetical protein n=1 Tax=Arthrobacter sp. GCM10027362 TaxID=3273379 RepID=UPI0036288CB8
MNRTLAAGAIALLLAGCVAPGNSAGQDRQSPPAGRQAEAPQESGKESAAGSGAKAAGKAEQKPPKTAKEAAKVEQKKLSAAESAYAAALDEPGVYPVAVVESGREACDRLAYLGKADPDILPGALASGEIPNAAEAIAHLCPEFGPQLKAGTGGFGDGQVAVADKAVPGKSIMAGAYRAVSPDKACSWQVVDKRGTVLAEGSIEDGDPAKLKVPGKAASVSTSNCYAWIPAE